MNAVMGGLDTGEDYEKAMGDPAFVELEGKWEDLYSQMEAYENYPDKEAEYIWLYLRK